MKKRNYHYDNSVFYGRLDNLRKARNCATFKDFAKEIGIKEANISKWKAGASSPRIETLILICNECGCDLDYLLGKTNTMHKENDSIFEETGLSEEAIEQLRSYQRAKKEPESIFHGRPENVLVPAFISFALTHKDKKQLYNDHVLETILESLIRQRHIQKQIDELPPAMEKFCYQSFVDMYDNEGFADRGWYIFWAQNSFDHYLPELEKEYAGESREEIFKRVELTYDLIRGNNDREALYYNLTQKLLRLIETFIDQQ